MQLPLVDINSIADSFHDLASDVAEAYEDVGLPFSGEIQPPDLIMQAMYKLFDLLRTLDNCRIDCAPIPEQSREDQSMMANHDIHELGDYGINLLIDISICAKNLKMERHSHELENLTFPLAIWIARQCGELSTLEPVVNALAILANTIGEPLHLEQLYLLTGEIQDAVSPLLQSDRDRSNPNRPWRVLLLNRAIIATRSHRSELMEEAYGNLVEKLPEDAAGFFRQGMEQMEALNYPDHVRDIVLRYFHKWSAQRTLH
ncbi:hypothetical protein DJ030_02075 [bacterium endosymbiont of Escarpia laminata]|nr:MAG: hypothetical protein DJ030_02075 [bacterium endosymbiont of Escarpia laminata]